MDDQQLSEAQDIQETTPHGESGGVLVRRMFEVFCISIEPDPCSHEIMSYPIGYKLNSVCDGKPCRIYGLVRVFSEDGHALIDIYNRDKDNFETVEFGGFLSITNTHVVSPSFLRVVVYLYDMAHDAEIANGFFDLDYRFERYIYDAPLKEMVYGQYGCAAIHHSTFQHAVVANVDRVVLNKIDESGSDSKDGMMPRTVTARLERTLPCYTGYPEEFPSSILFNGRRGGSEPFEFGVPVKLFRSSIVVPSFCSLVISFLDNADRKVVEDIGVDIKDGGLIEITSKGQCCEVVLEGQWRQGYASKPTQLVLSDKQSSSNIASGIPTAFPCVEIFSVLLWIDDIEMDISGTVSIMDSSRSPFRIFQGQETWSPGIALPVIGPPYSFDIEPFKFQTHIQGDENRFVSKGSFEWNIEDNDNDGTKSFYDKLLCSVIRGEAGYAAVHYSVITYAVQAHISVLIYRRQSGHNYPVEVSGKITAKYGGYDYPTLYDKEYYKSTIFSKPPTECVRVDLTKDRTELPLIKYVVSVPLDDLLVLDVDLTLLIPGRDDKGNIIESKKISQVVKERLQFVTDVATCYRFSKYDIRVMVDMSNTRKYKP